MKITSPITDHAQLGGLTDDDHTQYQKESEKGAVNGYCGLDASGLVVMSDLPANVARIVTATYTGDGTVSLAVTGAGGTPKAVLIQLRATADFAATVLYFSSDQMVDDNAAGMALSVDQTAVEINTVISFDADGVTVDDDGADAHPNQLGAVYNAVFFL